MKNLTWYNKIGFYNNPFSIKPAAFDNDVLGYDKIISEVNASVATSSIVFVQGKYGTGKTTILKGIIAEFGGKKKVIYYNCNESYRSIDFDRLLINAGCFFSRLFGIRKKGKIILLDEAQDMNKKDLKHALKYYNEGFFSSIVFVSTKDDIGMSDTLKIIVKKNKYKLGIITPKQAIELVRKRIGDLEIISDKDIISIFSKNKNPRAFLKNCEDVFREAVESGNKKVTKKHINKIKK